MNDLRTAAQQALEALDAIREADMAGATPKMVMKARSMYEPTITALRAALAQEQAERVDEYRKGFIAGQIEMRDRDGEQAEPVKKREDFDHGVGADRFKVVRGAYWWHVLIGDSPTKHGKFHTQTGAEEMAALLLREFRNGAFVQHEAAQEQAEPVQEPVAWVECDGELVWNNRETAIGRNLYTAPPRRTMVPLTDEEAAKACGASGNLGPLMQIARAIEKASWEKNHGQA